MAPGEVQEHWHDLARALERCTALRVLELQQPFPEGLRFAQAEDLELHTINLPQLRTFILKDDADTIHIMLSNISIPSAASMSLIMEMSTERRFNDVIPRNYLRRFCADPFIDRLYLNYQFYRSEKTAARCYAGKQERLHLATFLYNVDGLHGFLEPLFVACAENQLLSTLTIDISPSDADTPDVTFFWGVLLQRLPHLRRLELLGRTPGRFKQHFATTFLNVGGDQGSPAELNGLTLAWVVLLDEEGFGGGVVSELGDLASVLEGTRRCARLELYGVRSGNDLRSIRCLADIPTYPDTLRTVAVGRTCHD
ncbi:hypothetical protein C8Q80DRAFT_292818 [Daedaleopsis nitida]|nr:hypothetical protein C8Q80DRAFT_292818 [Daedaleopsis nitida]